MPHYKIEALLVLSFCIIILISKNKEFTKSLLLLYKAGKDNSSLEVKIDSANYKISTLIGIFVFWARAFFEIVIVKGKLNSHFSIFKAFIWCFNWQVLQHSFYSKTRNDYVSNGWRFISFARVIQYISSNMQVHSIFYRRHVKDGDGYYQNLKTLMMESHAEVKTSEWIKRRYPLGSLQNIIKELIVEDR